MAVVFWRRKVGGIPVAAIAAVMVAVLVVVAWKIAPAPEVVEETGNPDGIDEEDIYYDLADGPGESGLTTTGGFVAQPVYGTVPVTPASYTVDTNELWAKRAIEWLSANGTNAITATSAVQAFLEGAALSYAQGGLIDRAVKQLGMPPEPVTPGTVGLAPAQRQGNPPTTHTVKGTMDNTYAKLATLYYGNAATLSIGKIAGVNASRLGTAGAFAIGTKVTIPAMTAPKYVSAKSPTYDEPGEIGKRNNISVAAVFAMNPGMKFPVKSGTRVRVG